MYYVIDALYVGDDITDNCYARTLEITPTLHTQPDPDRRQSVHGPYETEQQAKAAIFHRFGRDLPKLPVIWQDEADGMAACYGIGIPGATDERELRIRLSRTITPDYVQPLTLEQTQMRLQADIARDVTTYSADDELDELLEQYEAFANFSGYTLHPDTIDLLVHPKYK